MTVEEESFIGTAIFPVRISSSPGIDGGVAVVDGDGVRWCHKPRSGESIVEITVTVSVQIK